MATPWISLIALGAILGFLGQSVRVVVGLKKARDEAAALGKTFTEAFEPSTMLVSLLIGGVAGALAAIMALRPDTNIATETLLGLAAAGYSGADFIEGFIARYLPVGGAPAPPPAAAAVPLRGPPAPLPAPGPLTALAQGPAVVTPLPAIAGGTVLPHE